MQTCAITGHPQSHFSFRYDETHPECIAIKSALHNEFVRLYKDGVRCFLVGGTVGVDTWAAEILLDMRKDNAYKDLVIRLVLAFPEQAERFTKNQKKRFRRIWERCKPENRITVSEVYSPDVYKRRDYYMVGHSDCLVAVYDGENGKRSSTAVMVNYAKKKGLTMKLISSRFVDGPATE